jgi:hypothetical protein
MNKIISTSKALLVYQDLWSLIQKRTLAIHLRGFCGGKALERLRGSLLNHSGRGPLSQAKEFGRLGFAYSEISDDASRATYHQSALEGIARIRDLASPFLSPVDELRLLLEERWPWGARLLQVGDRKCFVGICRFQDPGVDLSPHTDRLERNLPEGVQSRLLNQLSANLYLELPPRGGELEIWDLEPSEEHYQALKAGRPYGMDRSGLPQPAVTLKPETGDLVLFNPGLVHAVRPGQDVTRVTLGMFIGFLGQEHSLIYWS